MNYNVNIIYKKVKYITLRVKQDGTVNLTVPFGIPESEALKFAKKKEKWIIEKINLIGENNIKKELSFINGDTIYYMGKLYTLKVIKSPKNEVQCNLKNIEIYVDNVDNYQKKVKILHSWYLERAKEVFKDKIEHFEGILNEEVKTITIRPMKTRWGSCNTRLRKINLNLELIRRDEKCIEYVVLHEMAHLVHPNHSKEFWVYVEKYMGDYKTIRNKLRENN